MQGSAARNAFRSPAGPLKVPAAPQLEIRCAGCASPSFTQQREAPALQEPARSRRVACPRPPPDRGLKVSGCFCGSSAGAGCGAGGERCSKTAGALDGMDEP
ncbi:hypothetical protein RLOC_00012538 [Lonchura striata]|uniref:Uncharacterized protein n=1 Tax=Lonchura striata TaxID=40157 RepID=A0A218V7W7_9PASE|nr:hypothetical protein RLOC_00012538 [Lonchura striata domestica]